MEETPPPVLQPTPAPQSGIIIPPANQRLFVLLGVLVVVAIVGIFFHVQTSTTLVTTPQDAPQKLQNDTVSAAYITEIRGYKLAPLSEPPDPPGEYWYIYKEASDMGAAMIFKHDGTTGLFTERQVAYSYLDSNFPDMSSFAPDGTKFLSVQNPRDHKDERTLFLVDLDTDSARAILTLSLEETFVEYFEPFAAYPISEKEWVDSDTIRYTVFDATKEVEGSYPEEKRHPKLRVETMDL